MQLPRHHRRPSQAPLRVNLGPVALAPIPLSRRQGQGARLPPALSARQLLESRQLLCRKLRLLSLLWSVQKPCSCRWRLCPVHLAVTQHQVQPPQVLQAPADDRVLVNCCGDGSQVFLAPYNLSLQTRCQQSRRGGPRYLTTGCLLQICAQAALNVQNWESRPQQRCEDGFLAKPQGLSAPRSSWTVHSLCSQTSNLPVAASLKFWVAPWVPLLVVTVIPIGFTTRSSRRSLMMPSVVLSSFLVSEAVLMEIGLPFPSRRCRSSIADCASVATQAEEDLHGTTSSFR
mmetsp:Transcript_64280/g.114316  ORF Transcript_64280/g.114316 Transcript_64280/m.114316 type:complete len:287 (+) Transcript_64280:1424-2284(+)